MMIPEVNGYDVYGNRCPLPTYYAYPCPQLCVRDIADCPASVRPSCPEGQTYCVDGTCRSSCPANLQSGCACPGAPSLSGSVYPCKDGERADIPNFVATNKSAHSAEACAAKLGLPASIPAWSADAEYPIMWGECPTPDYGELTFTEPVFIALYVFYGSCVAMLVLWTLYKRTREKVRESENV